MIVILVALFRLFLRPQLFEAARAHAGRGLRGSTLAGLLLSGTLIACGAGPVPAAAVPVGTLAPTGTLTVPTTFANGRVELAISGAGYPLAAVANIPITVQAARGTISGPLTARILAEGFGGGGTPSEVLVRNLAVTAVTASAGQRRITSVSWDGRDEKGVLVPADAYSLVLTFRLDDGGTSSTATAASTIHLNGP